MATVELHERVIHHMNTTIDVQLHYGGKWLPGELIVGQDGMPRVLVAGETEASDWRGVGSASSAKSVASLIFGSMNT